jgi:hypothetical protein
MRGYKLIHAIAHCRDCGLKEEDYNTAPKKGREHHNKTGHTVDVEIGFWREYSKEPKKPEVKKNG